MNEKAQKLNRIMAGLCSAGLVAVAAYFMANMTWAVLPAAEASTTPVAASSNSARASTKQQWNANWLRQQPLFGQAARRPTQVRRPTQPASRPSNNVRRADLRGVRLTGLITYDNPIESRAILDLRGRTEMRKRGDVLDQKQYARVIVADILVDRIMLNDNGVMKELLLEKFGAAQASPSRRAVVSNARPSAIKNATGRFKLDRSRKPSQQLGDLRNYFRENPNKIMEVAPQYVRWRQHKVNGQVAGYKIYAGGKGRNLFRKSGLKNGDIVKAVNNMPVSNPLAIAEMGATQNNFSLTIDRRGQEQVVNVSLSE